VVLGAAVPEAPIQEDRYSGLGEDHVCGAPQVRQRASGDPVAESQSMYGRA
jgi:hypothetical protein